MHPHCNPAADVWPVGDVAYVAYVACIAICNSQTIPKFSNCVNVCNVVV